MCCPVLSIKSIPTITASAADGGEWLCQLLASNIGLLSTASLQGCRRYAEPSCSLFAWTNAQLAGARTAQPHTHTRQAYGLNKRISALLESMSGAVLELLSLLQRNSTSIALDVIQPGNAQLHREAFTHCLISSIVLIM